MSEPEFDPEAPTLDVGFYRDGGNRLSESEREILGDVLGLRVLVSPEGSGDEVLSLLAMGAEVTVLGGQLDVIEAAAEELEFNPRLVVGGFGEALPDEIDETVFDLVYSPWGTMDGRADLDPWARDVSDRLATGGHLVVYDEHPVSFMLEGRDGALFVKTSYWGEFIDENHDGAPDVPEFAPTTFGWAMGDLITALGDNGMAVIRLEEFPESDRYLTSLELVEGISDEQRAMLPSAFLLVARKIED